MADWQLKPIASCLILLTTVIGSCITCRVRSANCQCCSGDVTKNESPTKSAPEKGVHGDMSTTKQPGAEKRKKCCPYDFDSSLCRTVNDRILCGFNRNRGRLGNNQEYRELSDGCRLRGGRVECGYVQPPYANTRRPPPHYTDEPRQDYNGGEQPGADTDQNNLIAETTKLHWSPAESKQKRVPQNELIKTTAKTKYATRCVEINDRIVCRRM